MRQLVLALSFCAALAAPAAAQKSTLLEAEPSGEAAAPGASAAKVIPPAPAAPASVSTAAAPAAKAAAVKPPAKRAKKKAAAGAAKPSAAVTKVTEYPSKFEMQPSTAQARAAVKKPARGKKNSLSRKPSVPPALPPEPAGSGGFAVDRRHKVAGGDTLWGLSGKYYGDPFKWGKIYNANMNTVANPDRIYPKEELVIPGVKDEVKPALGGISGSDTVTEGEFSASDESTLGADSVPAVSEPVSPVARINVINDDLAAYQRNELSSEMPVDQKEWSSFLKVVPDDWVDDGVVSSKVRTDSESVDEGLSFSGDQINVRMRAEVKVKKGDYLTVYLKGAPAFDKNGKRLGREIQPAGVVEVLEVDGDKVKARVMDASSGIGKGLVVKVTVRS